MELANIEKLLEAYFEGSTSLSEEKELQTYFTNEPVAPHLEKYQPLFESFIIARQEVSKREIKVPNESVGKQKVWWYGIAASIIIALTIANFMFSGPSFSPEEKEALTAFNESKKAMLLLSENFNKGAGHLAVMNEFTETKNRILK
jgi:hypothetical protein